MLPAKGSNAVNVEREEGSSLLKRETDAISLKSEALEEEHCPSTCASLPFPSVPIPVVLSARLRKLTSCLKYRCSVSLLNEILSPSGGVREKGGFV